MEIKEILGSLGLPIAALILSGFSLYISFQNRRNAIREHLYKEQMSFFIALLERVSSIDYHFQDVEFDKKIPDEKDDLIDKEISDLDKFFDKYSIIIPNDKIYDSIHNVIMKAYSASIDILKKQGAINEKDLEPFSDSYYKLIDELREFVGVEILSNENQNLYAKSIKQEANEARKQLPKI